MNKGCFARLILAVLFPALVFSEGENLSLEQARALALANSQSLAKYRLAVRSGVLDERSQLYANLPSLSLNAGASVNLWDPEGMPQENLSDSFNASAGVSVSQKIFEGGKSLVLRDIYSINTEITRKDALAEYFTVLDSADRAYYAVLEAGANLAEEESSLETAALSLSIAELRRESGMIGPGDYLKALADKETREASRNQARRTLSLNAAKLKSLTGFGETPRPEAVDFAGYEETIRRLSAIPDEKIEALYAEFWSILAAKNPGLAKAGLSGARAEKNLSLAKRDYSPSLSASFSTGLSYTRLTGPEANSGRLSLSGSIPLDYWVTANNVEKSRIARDSAAVDYRAAESSLETELLGVLLDAITQAGSVVSSRRAWEYAEKHFEYVMELYRLSRNSVSELSDASSLVSSSRGGLIRAQYGFLRALSDLRSLGALEDERELLRLLEES
ncbi:MAG: TolC family protein [Treponema sp.]|jgi:outer membrane protein TolC|nr:TolC family protein [Treponema sp.]